MLLLLLLLLTICMFCDAKLIGVANKQGSSIGG